MISLKNVTEWQSIFILNILNRYVHEKTHPFGCRLLKNSNERLCLFSAVEKPNKSVLKPINFPASERTQLAAPMSCASESNSSRYLHISILCGTVTLKKRTSGFFKNCIFSFSCSGAIGNNS